MKVKAASGLCVPRELNSRTYITDDEAVDVEETSYYLRRLETGELVRIDDDSDKTPAKTPAKIRQGAE